MDSTLHLLAIGGMLAPRLSHRQAGSRSRHQASLVIQPCHTKLEQHIPTGHPVVGPWQPATSPHWRPENLGGFASHRSSFSGGAGASAPRRSHSSRDYGRTLGEIESHLGNLDIAHNELRQDFNNFAGGMVQWQQQTDQSLTRIQQQGEDIMSWLQANYPHRQQ